MDSILMAPERRPIWPGCGPQPYAVLAAVQLPPTCGQFVPLHSPGERRLPRRCQRKFLLRLQWSCRGKVRFGSSCIAPPPPPPSGRGIW